MNTFLILFNFALCCALVYTQSVPKELLEEYKEISRKCTYCSHLDGNRFVDELFAGNLFEEESIIRHLVCVEMRIGALTRSGRVNVEGFRAVLENLGDPNAERVLQACSKTKESIGKTAYDLYTCWLENTGL